MDGSAACSSGAAARGVDTPSLPCPDTPFPALLSTPPCTREESSIPVHSKKHRPLAGNTTILYFLQGFLQMFSNFLSPITQHHPCNHTSDVFQCKVPVKHQQANTAETLLSHGCSGNDCTTCRDRLSACMSCEREHGYQSCQPLHELDSA